MRWLLVYETVCLLVGWLFEGLDPEWRRRVKLIPSPMTPQSILIPTANCLLSRLLWRGAGQEGSVLSPVLSLLRSIPSAGVNIVLHAYAPISQTTRPLGGLGTRWAKYPFSFLLSTVLLLLLVVLVALLCLLSLLSLVLIITLLLVLSAGAKHFNCLTQVAASVLAQVA